MAERRRRRQRSDVSSEGEEEEAAVWSGSDATASEVEESEHESDKTDEELSALQESTPSTDKEDTGAATPEIQSPAHSDSGEADIEEEEEEKIEDNEDEKYESDKEDEKSDDENPTHIPKRGQFYQHDDRNYVDPKSRGNDGDRKRGRAAHTDSTGRVWGGKKESKWTHDMFDENEQKPKEEWEKQKQRRNKTREGGDRPRRDGPRNYKRRDDQDTQVIDGQEPDYKEFQLNDDDNADKPRRKNLSKEGIGRGRNSSRNKSNESEQIGLDDEPKDTYRRKDVGTDNREERRFRDRAPREKDREYRDPVDGPTSDRGASRRGRGTRGEYQPQKFDKKEPSTKPHRSSEFVQFKDESSDYNSLTQQSERGRYNSSRRRGGTTRTDNYRREDREEQNKEVTRESEYRPRGGRTRDSTRDSTKDSTTDSTRDNRDSTRDRRAPRNLNYDPSDDYDIADHTDRRRPRRGREDEDDEIWKQIEQLKKDVQRVSHNQQDRPGEGGGGTVVGKGRARHTRTSPLQDSLIYNIAQEKAQERAAANGHTHTGSRTLSNSDEDERNAVATSPPAPSANKPKYISSTVQTEGEVITMKPKRYSQRSKNIDSNAIREKVHSTLEDFNQYNNPGYGAQDPAYPPTVPYNIYAQEFVNEQHEGQPQYTEAQQTQLNMMQMNMMQMPRNFPPQVPPPSSNDYMSMQAALLQQQAQQQHQAQQHQQLQQAMMAGAVAAGYNVHAGSRQMHMDPDLVANQMIKRSSKAIPIVDPSTQIHMTQVLHES